MASTEQLKQISILAPLEQDELESLAPLLGKREFKKKNHIITKDDDSKNLMFLLEGKAKVTISSIEGKEVILAYLSPGDFFGELALLTGEDRSADVVAMNSCSVLFLSEADFRKHSNKFQGLNLAIMKELALRLRTATAKIADLALYDVYQRSLSALKSLAEEKEVEGERILIIQDRPKHQELASMIGTSREMVTRALKSLEEDGLIEMDGKKVTIWGS